MHNLEVESYVLVGGFSEDFKPRRQGSDHSEGWLQRGQGGAGINRSFCNTDKVVGTSKDYC